ncbi:MAG: hypothetical protein AB7S92_14230 [Parvibaculaceae bacterium]
MVVVTDHPTTPTVDTLTARREDAAGLWEGKMGHLIRLALSGLYAVILFGGLASAQDIVNYECACSPDFANDPSSRPEILVLRQTGPSSESRDLPIWDAEAPFEIQLLDSGSRKVLFHASGIGRLDSHEISFTAETAFEGEELGVQVDIEDPGMSGMTVGDKLFLYECLRK